jgi:tetratricopeptide (TPR) repeat protein
MSIQVGILIEQGDLQEARKLAEAVLALRRKVLPAEHPEIIGAMYNLAETLILLDRLAEAHKLSDEALQLSRRKPRARRGGGGHLGAAAWGRPPRHARRPARLGGCDETAGRAAGRPETARGRVPRQKRLLGPANPQTLASMTKLADVLYDLGQFEDARNLYEEEIEVRKRAGLAKQRRTFAAMGNLATVHIQQNKLDDAARLLEECPALQKANLPPEDRDTLTCMNNLALVWWKQKKLSEARKLHEEVLGIRRRLYGDQHADTLRSMNNLFMVLMDQAEWEAARKLMQELIAGSIQVNGPDHPATTVSAMKALGKVVSLQAAELKSKGLPEEEAKLHRDVLDFLKTLEPTCANVPQYQAQLAATHNHLAWLLANGPDEKQRDPAAAVEHGNKAVVAAEKFGRDKLLQGSCYSTLGTAHYRAGDGKAAGAAFEKALPLRNGGDGYDYFFLAMVHWQLGDKKAAADWHKKGMEWMEKNKALLEKNKTADTELRRIRAEADKLLGVNEK